MKPSVFVNLLVVSPGPDSLLRHITFASGQVAMLWQQRGRRRNPPFQPLCRMQIASSDGESEGQSLSQGIEKVDFTGCSSRQVSRAKSDLSRGMPGQQAHAQPYAHGCAPLQAETLPMISCIPRLFELPSIFCQSPRRISHFLRPKPPYRLSLFHSPYG
jgi:hypothetical protein